MSTILQTTHQMISLAEQHEQTLLENGYVVVREGLVVVYWKAKATVNECELTLDAVNEDELELSDSEWDSVIASSPKAKEVA